MTWPEIERLFFASLEIPRAERDRWLDEQPDPQVASDVRSLLEAHEACESCGPMRRVGAYRLERLLGRGGMGEVWLGSRADGQFEQRVAVKLVRYGLGMELLGPRFQRERQLLARLNHPNVAALLDGGVAADGRPYLVMEYVDGEPILDFCEHRGLDLRARVSLIRQLCSAVAHAHRNLIVHRDIKPGNVLVTADGSPKLLDFGVAKLLEADDHSTVTVPLATPRYASPEQLRGDPVSTASDVYSLGVLLFELLTGSLPYSIKGNTAAEVISAITAGAPRRASEIKRSGSRPVPAGDPGDVDAILLKALERDPAARYGSVESFDADLENYLHNCPVTARAPTVAYRLGKYARRHWAGIAAGAVAAMSLALVSAISIRAAHLANLQEAHAERVTQFLEDMLASVDPRSQGGASKTGREVRVVDLLPAARDRIAATFADDPEAQARLHGVLARAYTDLQQFPEAEAEAKAALALLPSLGNNPGQKAKLLFTAGNLDYLLSHRIEEEQELRQAVDILERTPALSASAPQHALYLSKLAEALADVGKKAEAQQYADRAARLLESISSSQPVQTGEIHGSLAMVYIKVGRLEQARGEAHRAIEQLSRSARPVSDLASMEMWLSIIERNLGDIPAALAAAEHSVKDAERALAPDDALNTAPRIELAYLRAVNGNTAQALPDLTRLLAQARAAASQEDLFHALHSLGYALTLAGRAREGEPLLREALQVGSRFLSPSGPSMGICDFELGECLYRQGRRAESRGYYQIARDNLDRYYGPVFSTQQAALRLAQVSETLAAK
jgi:eukaryotic-like serine/threonine-protein kinase